MRASTKTLVLAAATALACASTAAPPKNAVEQLLNAAVSAPDQAGQQRAFDGIIKLGCAAVPDLVRHLRDPRPLPVPYIRLDNDFPGAFEAYAQYGPEIVTDAVAAMLAQLTRRDFGFIYNGASPAQRDQTIAAWEAYLAETPREQLCP
jgi:hypothetical protein